MFLSPRSESAGGNGTTGPPKGAKGDNARLIAPALDPMPDRLGPYRVSAILGRGGMGVVYSAAHIQSGSKVAIKTVSALTALALSALRTEVQALKRVHHPGVVRIVDEGLSDELPWYAMECLEGRTLEAFNREVWQGGAELTRDITRTTAARSGAIDPVLPVGAAAPIAQEVWQNVLPLAACGRLPEFLDFYRGVCAGLDHIHRRGLVHRDLKPSNVFLRHGVEPVLMDFGLASPSGGGIGRETLSSRLGDRIHGTLSYLSPEQIRGEIVDARADLYALGCMMYETLVGQTPYVQTTTQAMIWGHIHDTPCPPSNLVRGIPPELDELVLRLLAKTPHARIGQAEDVAAVLRRQGAASPFRPPTASMRSPIFTARA